MNEYSIKNLFLNFFRTALRSNLKWNNVCLDLVKRVTNFWEFCTDDILRSQGINNMKCLEVYFTQAFFFSALYFTALFYLEKKKHMKITNIFVIYFLQSISFLVYYLWYYECQSSWEQQDIIHLTYDWVFSQN